MSGMRSSTALDMSIMAKDLLYNSSYGFLVCRVQKVLYADFLYAPNAFLC